MFRELLEAKMKPSAIVKELKGPDWNMGDYVYVKKGNLVVIDTFFYGEDKAMKDLKNLWSTDGAYGKYFKDTYGIEFKVVDEFSEFKASGKHKKLSDDGIVGIELKVV